MTKKIILPILAAVFLVCGIALTLNVQSATNKIAVDLPCVQTAVEKRDNAIISACDKLSAAVKTALSSRKSALKDGWGKTDKKERAAAIKKARTDYQSAVKSGRQTLASERKAAWRQFRIDVKACHGTAEDSAVESIDNSL